MRRRVSPSQLPVRNICPLSYLSPFWQPRASFWSSWCRVVDRGQISCDVGTPLTHGCTNDTETSTMVTEPRSTDPFDKSTSRTRTMTTTGRCEYVRSLFSTRSVGSSSPHRPGGSGWAGVANEIAAIVFPRTVPQNNGAKWRNLTLTHIRSTLPRDNWAVWLDPK